MHNLRFDGTRVLFEMNARAKREKIPEQASMELQKAGR